MGGQGLPERSGTVQRLILVNLEMEPHVGLLLPGDGAGGLPCFLCPLHSLRGLRLQGPAKEVLELNGSSFRRCSTREGRGWRPALPTCEAGGVWRKTWLSASQY
jgi:hypothetical protein